FGHHTRGGETGQDQPARTVAKSTFQQIHPDETRRGLETYRRRAAAASLGEILLSPPTAVPVELLKVLVERIVCVVEERILDLTNRSFGHIDVLVDEIRVVTQIAPEQSHRLVAAPAAVSYLL